MAGVGLLLTLLGAVPGIRDGLQWMVASLPGAGLLRDGQKFVALVVPLAAVLAACGAERLAGRMPDRTTGGVLLVGVALLQVAFLPDLAWGAGRRLDAVDYPAAWSEVRSAVKAEPADGDLMLLPWGAFRAYPWNGRRTVLDPAQRYFPRDKLADDRLVVGDTVLAPEDPRSDAVARRLAATGRLDAAFLRRQGVRLVLVQTGQPGDDTPLAGVVEVARAPGLRLVRVPGQVPRLEDQVAGGTAGKAAVVVVDLAAVTLLLAAAAGVVVRRRRGRG
jgi:hypothetical protein